MRWQSRQANQSGDFLVMIFAQAIFGVAQNKKTAPNRVIQPRKNIQCTVLTDVSNYYTSYGNIVPEH